MQTSRNVTYSLYGLAKHYFSDTVVRSSVKYATMFSTQQRPNPADLSGGMVGKRDQLKNPGIRGVDRVTWGNLRRDLVPPWCPGFCVPDENYK